MVKLTRMFPLLALIVGVVLSVLPAEGQISPKSTVINGKGTGIDPGNQKNTAGITISGEDDFGVDIFHLSTFTGCPNFVTVLAAVNTQQGLRGNDVYPFNDGFLLDMRLDPSTKSGTGNCLYTGPDPNLIFGPLPLRPDLVPLTVRLILGADGGGTGTSFHFTFQLRQGKYVSGDPVMAANNPTCPTGLPPGTPVRVMLTTRFSLSNIPVGFPNTFDDTVNWRSSGLGSVQDCDFLHFP